MSSRRIRVLLADDNKALRWALVESLRSFPDIEIVGEASTGKAAVELAGLTVPDVIIMDINMPEMNGIEATQAIHRALPQVWIVGLSILDDDYHRNAMRQAGAADFVSKTESADALVASIRRGGLPDVPITRQQVA